MDKLPCVYLMTNARNGILYIGLTSNLHKRVWEHRNHVVEGFTKQHRLTKLVYYEVHNSMYQAITREKQLKNWQRQWKIELIEQTNPYWRDLWEDICGS